MTGDPVNVWGVSATIEVTSTDPAAASTALGTAITDIKAALVTLANGTEFSVAEINGAPAFDEPDGANGVFSVSSCQLIISAEAAASAQGAAKAAATAINTAIGAISPAVAVTLEEETSGAEAGFVLQLLQ